MVRRLTDDYPAMSGNAYGPNIAERLVTEWRVVPVLDGLDELPLRLRTKAVAAISRITARGAPLVVTCRRAEYDEAVTNATSVPANVTTIEIKPAEPHAVIAFLSADGPSSARRWEPVFRRILADPNGALATTLATPLMASLAHTAYQAGEPAELLDLPDRKAVEAHLLDAFLPTAYADRQPSAPASDSPAPSKLHRYRTEYARQWLTTLARVATSNNGNLAWWRVNAATQGSVSRLYTGVASLVVAGAAGLAFSGGLYIGCSGKWIERPMSPHGGGGSTCVGTTTFAVVD